VEMGARGRFVVYPLLHPPRVAQRAQTWACDILEKAISVSPDNWQPREWNDVFIYEMEPGYVGCALCGKSHLWDVKSHLESKRHSKWASWFKSFTVAAETAPPPPPPPRASSPYDHRGVRPPTVDELLNPVMHEEHLGPNMHIPTDIRRHGEQAAELMPLPAGLVVSEAEFNNRLRNFIDALRQLSLTGRFERLLNEEFVEKKGKAVMEITVPFDGKLCYVKTAGDVLQRVVETRLSQRAGFAVHHWMSGWNAQQARFFDRVGLGDALCPAAPAVAYALAGWCEHARADLVESITLFLGARMLAEYMTLQGMAAELWHVYSDAVPRCSFVDGDGVCWKHASSSEGLCRHHAQHPKK